MRKNMKTTESVMSKEEMEKKERIEHQNKWDKALDEITTKHSRKNHEGQPLALSSNTLNILKLCGNINRGLHIRKGNVIATMTVMRHIFLMAEVEEEFPCDVPIYNLKDFLRKYSLHKNPKLDFFDDHLMIYGEGDTYSHILYSDPNMIVSPGDKRIKIPEDGIVLNTVLYQEQMKKIIFLDNKSKSRMKSFFWAKDGYLFFSTGYVGYDLDFSIYLCDFDGVDFFEEIQCSMDLLFNGDYAIKINTKGIMEMRNLSMNITYFFALNINSEFKV